MQQSMLAGTAPGPTTRPIQPGTRIGHVHLKVADLDRALAFMRRAGLQMTKRSGPEIARGKTPLDGASDQGVNEAL